MSSYLIRNGDKKGFRFFEHRDWEESQEYYANHYFIFRLSGDDLKSMAYALWAHQALWKHRLADEEISAQYQIKSFEEVVCKELYTHQIDDDPPNFGYDHPDLDVLALHWESPRFRILHKSEHGIHCIDDDLVEYYLDLDAADICSPNELEYDTEDPSEHSYFTCDPGDPVFMNEKDFSFLKMIYSDKVNLLNQIYAKAKFPHKIIID